MGRDKHMFRLVLLLLSLLISSQIVAGEEFLKPEKAFIASVKTDGKKAIVTWNIMPGYYLYQSKLRFTSTTPGISLSVP